MIFYQWRFSINSILASNCAFEHNKYSPNNTPRKKKIKFVKFHNFTILVKFDIHFFRLPCQIFFGVITDD